MTDDRAVTRKELAGLLGCKASYVNALRAAGRVVLAADGKHYLLEATRRRIAETRDPAKLAVAERHAAGRGSALALPGAAGAGEGASVPSQPPSSPAQAAEAGGDRVGASYQQSRAVRERFMALQAKLDYERAIGRLLEATEVEHALSTTVTALRARLENLPEFLGAPLAAEQSEARCVALLRDYIDQALADLSRHFSEIAKGPQP